MIGRASRCGLRSFLVSLPAGMLCAVLAAAGPAGCLSHHVEGVRVPLIVRDSSNGRLLNDCLLLRCKEISEGDQGRGEMAAMRSRTERAEVLQVDSGHIIDQPAMYEICYPVFTMTHIRQVSYKYAVLKEGYVPLAIYGFELVWEGRHGTAKVVDLPCEMPAWMTGDNSNPRYVLGDAIPHIPPDHPLRKRLEKIVRKYPSYTANK